MICPFRIVREARRGKDLPAAVFTGLDIVNLFSRECT